MMGATNTLLKAALPESGSAYSTDPYLPYEMTNLYYVPLPCFPSDQLDFEDRRLAA
jgi:hypothetical protein